MRLQYFVALVATLALARATCHATPVSYTFSFSASGTVGSTAFPEEAITLVGMTDTNTILTGLGRHNNQEQGPLSSLYLTIGTTTTGVTAAGGPQFVSYDGDGPDVALGPDVIAGGAPDYDGSVLFENATVSNAIGPGNVRSVTTDLGLVTFTVLNGTRATFTTTINTTPEPASVALFGTGLLGIAGLLRKRFA